MGNLLVLRYLQGAQRNGAVDRTDHRHNLIVVDQLIDHRDRRCRIILIVFADDLNRTSFNAAGSIDLLHGHHDALLLGQAHRRICAGHGAKQADFDRIAGSAFAAVAVTAVASAATAADQREHHKQNQENRKNLFHVVPPIIVLFSNTIVVLDEITPSAPKRELPAQLPLTRQRMGTAF